MAICAGTDVHLLGMRRCNLAYRLLEYRRSFGFAVGLGRRAKMPSQPGIAALPDTLAELRRDLSTAYRIVANEGILDAFGHISVRHPGNPQRYFLSRSRAPALVEAADILEYDLDSNPIVPPTTRPYSERVIHGEIFKARPDVNAVCHHHAPSIMPFAISGVPLPPGEAEMASGLNLAPGPVARAYEYWVRRLAEREGRGKSDSAVRAAEAAARRPNPGAATKAKASGAAKKAKKSRGKKR